MGVKEQLQKAYSIPDTEPTYVDDQGRTVVNEAYNERVRIEKGGDPKAYNTQTGETYKQERARLAKQYGIDDPYTAGVEPRPGAAEGYPPGKSHGADQNKQPDTTHLEDNS